MKKVLFFFAFFSIVAWAQTPNDAGVAAPGSPHSGTRDAVINGILGSGAPGFDFITGTQTGRIFRDGIPSVCGTAKTCSTYGTDTIIYDAYTLYNSGGSAQCVTITLTVPGTEYLHAIAYVNGYVAASYCTNYIGDCGSSSSSSTPQTFSVDLPAGDDLVIAVTEAYGDEGLGDAYTLEVTGAVGAMGIPTFGTWGLIAFVILLAIGGLFVMRKKFRTA